LTDKHCSSLQTFIPGWIMFIKLRGEIQ